MITAVSNTQVHFFKNMTLLDIKQRFNGCWEILTLHNLHLLFTIYTEFPIVSFRRHQWKEIQPSCCFSPAITATRMALAPATTCWRLWFFLFSTPFSSCWGWSSTAWLCGCFFASPPNRILSSTWRISLLLTSSWPSPFPLRFGLLGIVYPDLFVC